MKMKSRCNKVFNELVEFGINVEYEEHAEYLRKALEGVFMAGKVEGMEEAIKLTRKASEI